MATKEIVEVVSSVVTTLATILAGGFAYYRFVKGRVFKPRLTLTAHARQLRIQATGYVLFTIELSNVGLSRIDFEDATVRICSLSGNAVAATAGVPRRVWLDTCRVLLAHAWVESGEILKEQNLLTLPLDHDSPVLVDFRAVAQGVSLSATAIAEPAPPAAQDAGERL